MVAYKWGLNLQEAVLFDWLTTLPAWADTHVSSSGDTYYFASRNEAKNELPLLTDKPDTIYRYYKSLSYKGIIAHHKIEGKDFIEFTKKAGEWFKLGEISEETRKKIRKHSEKNPTYNNTINNNTKHKEAKPVIIPSYEEFEEYSLLKAKELKYNLDKQKLRTKFEAWKEGGWKTGGQRKIVNWKTTLLNTLMYLQSESNLDEKYKPKRLY